MLDVEDTLDINVDLETGTAVTKSADEYAINLDPDYVKSLGYASSKEAIGQKVKLAVSSQATEEQEIIEATITGVLNKSVIQGGNSLASDALSEKIMQIMQKNLPESMKDQYQAVIGTMQKDLTDKQTDKLKESLTDKGYLAMTVEDQIGMIRNIINAITSVLTMFGGIALLAASFGIINTLYMSVQDRTREIGLMKAMGMSGGKIFFSFSVEALLIGFWGSVLGILGAMGASSLINDL